MEQASRDGIDGAQTTAATNWAAWENYYSQASRRRRASGLHRDPIRVEKRRRQIRERLIWISSVAILGTLTLVFYTVLCNR